MDLYRLNNFPAPLTRVAANPHINFIDVGYGTGYWHHARCEPRYAVWVYRPRSWLLDHLGAVAAVCHNNSRIRRYRPMSGQAIAPPAGIG